MLSFDQLKKYLILIFIGGTFSSAASMNPLDPYSQPKFVNPIVFPGEIDLTGRGTAPVSITVTQFDQDLGLIGPNGTRLSTTVWGYNGTYPGPTILTRSNVPASIFWLNELVDATGRPLPHLLPVDTTLHWALHGVSGGIDQWGVPIVTHLHGGKTESESDGLPEAWYTPRFTVKGMEFYKGDLLPYYYSNAQPSSTSWYHDHTLGLTRLNVYAGLAGAYLLRDSVEEAMIAANALPSGAYEKVMVLQDRSFTDDGQLLYPAMDPMAPPTAMSMPSVMPEFFGDFNLVNGKTWPVMDVEPRPYRFRLINGSDSRFYHLYFREPVFFQQIGADMGFLTGVSTTNDLLIAPGERIDVVIDFSSNSLRNKLLVMRNDANTPFPNGDPIDPNTTGLVMAFRVTLPLNTRVPKAVLPAVLHPAPTVLTQNGPTRKLLLHEGTDHMGRLKPSLGTTADGALDWFAPITENPIQNTTEIWEVYNNTEDAHPVHLHSVAFQIIDRQKFTATTDTITGALSNIRTFGVRRQPAPGERGWKDTAPSYPGEVLRVIAKFTLPGMYVWHCHILSHEDHEMMRPLMVTPSPRMSEQHSNGTSPESLTMDQNIPNPFNDYTKIDFTTSESGPVSLEIFDMSGRLVEKVIDDMREAGTYSELIKTDQWESGMYLYVLTSNRKTISRRMVRQ